MDPWEALRQEAGDVKTREIALAALALVRACKAQPDGCGEGRMRIIVQRRVVLKVKRSVEVEERSNTTP